MRLSRDFKEFIESLNARDVRYLVIGGYALAFHGHPRYTKDLDVWIECSEENAEKLLAALTDFGFASLGLTKSDLLNTEVIQLGYPPARIDLITASDGLDFSNSYESKLSIQVDGVDVYYIDLESLKKNKASTGRKRDLADLELLEDS